MRLLIIGGIVILIIVIVGELQTHSLNLLGVGKGGVDAIYSRKSVRKDRIQADYLGIFA